MFDEIYDRIENGMSSFGDYLGNGPEEEVGNKQLSPPETSFKNSPSAKEQSEWGLANQPQKEGPKWGNESNGIFANKQGIQDNSNSTFGNKNEAQNKQGGQGNTVTNFGNKGDSQNKQGTAKVANKLGSDPATKLAEKQYKNYTSKTYNWPNFKTNNAWNVGKFDFKYNPSGKVADVTMKVKFLYPDVKGSSKKEIALKKAKSQNFINQTQNMWSRKFQFKNIRAPQKVWKKLNPVNVNVNVIEDNKSPHFTINMFQNKTGTAAVNADHTVDLFKGDYAPATAFPNTPKGETKRAKSAGATPVFFGNNSSSISGKYSTQLTNFANYMKRIDNPKFDILLEGHASTSGSSDHNLKLSESRMSEVQNKLKAAGLNNHNFTTKFVGETAGISGAKGRKVIVKAIADKSYINKQDVTPHEFGHMLGMDDEYQYSKAGAKLDHYGLVNKAFGKHYAEQVGRQDDTDSASLMNGGDQLRIHHYVTIWDALIQTSINKASSPSPRLGYKDWKFVE